MSKTFATYKALHIAYGKKDSPEGHIYLDKEASCQTWQPSAITLTGAANMPQHELDRYGEIMAEALNKSVCGSV